jgi:DNA primase catalytic core
MADNEAIYSILLARRYQEELFSELAGAGQKREKGGIETLVECPFCKKPGHFSYNSEQPVWNCLRCGENGDWIDYLEKTKGYDYNEARQELAAAAGVELSPQSQQAYQEKVRKASVLEAAMEYFKAALLADPAGAVYTYLTKRGYSEQDISTMEIGAYTDRAGLQEHLKAAGFSQEDIKASGLLTSQYGDVYKLALLWRSSSGRAIGLTARTLLEPAELEARGLDPKIKYKDSSGVKKSSGLIGFSSVRGAEELLLVEGGLDALYLNGKAKNLNAVAVGGTSLSATQLQAISQAGTKRLFLALDMDKAGRDALERLLVKTKLLRTGLKAYVVTLPGKYKDADELVRAEGVEPLQEAKKKAQRVTTWLAWRLVEKYDISLETEQDAALEEAQELLKLFEDELEARHFREALQQSLRLSEEELAGRLAGAEQAITAKKRQRLLEAHLQELQQRSQLGDILGAEEELAKALRDIQASRGLQAPEPYLVEQFNDDVLHTSPSLASGYSELDKVARIPSGAITIVAGRPGHGKTSLLLNLLVNMSQARPDKHFYYFSYEEAKKNLALKLLMILSGETLEKDSNYGAYINYLKEKRGSNAKIEKALAEYQQLSSSGRLMLIDDMYKAEDLANVISLLAERQEVGAVFVDYIQKIPLARPSGGQRYLDIKHISGLLLEQAVRQDIPIILGAQLVRDKNAGAKPKLENLRESGDIEQDANLVLGLYTKAIEEMEEQEASQASSQPEVGMEVRIMKNRGGLPGRMFSLAFNRPVYQIKNGSSIFSRKGR